VLFLALFLPIFLDIRCPDEVDLYFKILISLKIIYFLQIFRWIPIQLGFLPRFIGANGWKHPLIACDQRCGTQKAPSAKDPREDHWGWKIMNCVVTKLIADSIPVLAWIFRCSINDRIPKAFTVSTILLVVHGNRRLTTSLVPFDRTTLKQLIAHFWTIGFYFWIFFWELRVAIGLLTVYNA
jgi:hypothetical protein